MGYEAANLSMTSVNDLPWLQDTVTFNVWGSWAAAFRDIFILDRENRVVHIYNLNAHDLTVPTNYTDLKNLLLSVAGE